MTRRVEDERFECEVLKVLRNFDFYKILKEMEKIIIFPFLFLSLSVIIK